MNTITLYVLPVVAGASLLVSVLMVVMRERKELAELRGQLNKQ